MSYDIDIVDADGHVMALRDPHHMRGSIMCVGGEASASLNVTYNYSKFFYDALGQCGTQGGIQAIHGHSVESTLPTLVSAWATLSGEPSDDYWAATPGNAKEALANLITLGIQCPGGIWRIS